MLDIIDKAVATIDSSRLIAEAISTTGLDDFGAGPMGDGLEILCEALRSEAGLNATGKASVQKDIVGTLCERLRIEACLKAYPEILAQPLLRPIFVIGMPRTGSTALSQFLSEDSHARSIRRWEAAAITPPPDVNVVDDPRIVATRAAFAARDAAIPQFKSMLPIEAEDPSEHGTFLYLTFRSYQFSTLYGVPSYLDWLYEADMDCAYAYFRKALQILQWKTPGTHWNLKHPLDLFSLPAVSRIFPDATFVWTHRDPTHAIGSFASLMASLRAPTVEALDKHALMAYLLDFEAESVRRGLADRARIGEDRFVDFSQSNLSRDPVSAIHELYEQIDLPFTSEYESHLRERMASRPRGGHGKHAYDLNSFGVSAKQIDARFADYVERFECYF